ncbi:hypothetical protein VPNG_02431 [Cytospora leucostoma]|uniref:Heterokaryon incompatibility domain-containing protein n=1 Tax=Cytospora leucostoma TaxID=1230097 RepID=A0A423XGJ5_9PEZI|nr:hypothetical protein VPNG_02431 [Cytospora leucostoma]
MANLASRAFGKLQSGLPDMFFDVMLLWQPESESREEAIFRRWDLYVDEVAQGKKKALPSWSWAGWQCMIDYGPWLTAGGTQLPHWAAAAAWHEVIPIVEWSVSHGLDTESQKYKIGTAWHSAKCYNQDATDHIPEGWERHENTDRLSAEERTTLYPSWDHPFVYNLTANKEIGSRFLCPISIPVLRPDAQPEYPPYLHGSSQRAWLTCEDDIVHVPDATTIFGSRSETEGHFLLSKDGDRIGWLRLRRDTELDDGVTVAEVWQRESRRVELIALSRDVVQRKKRSWEGRRWITRPAGPLEEYYNVMWIGWNGRVALRRALGKVDRHAWEGLDREIVDITLA